MADAHKFRITMEDKALEAATKKRGIHRRWTEYAEIFYLKLLSLSVLRASAVNYLEPS
jgi:hypothetical protein